MSVECVNQLGFHRPLTSLAKESLVVRNANNRPIAFKIKTTAPKQYCVRPNSGRIEPGQEVEVQVLLQAMKEEPPADYKCRDKFLVQSTVISPENETLSISALWTAVEAKKNRHDIHEKKVRCVFLSQDGTSSHGISHYTYRDSSPTPDAAHGATEYHTNTFNTPVQASSEVFKVAPALASIDGIESRSSPAQPKSASTSSSKSIESQLREAKLEIEKLQQELSSSKTSRRSDSKSATHNEGVPVHMTAMIALIAFMAAYLLF